MLENIKAIVMDIDGTIAVSPNDPTNITIDTIDKLHESGYLVGLASGRTVADMFIRQDLWHIKYPFDFIIGVNGGELYIHDTNTTYTYNSLKREWIKEIIDFMAEFDAAIGMYKPGIYLSNKMTERAWYSATKNQRTFIVADSLEEFYKEDALGIMFRVSEDIMPNIEKKLKMLNDKPYKGFKTQTTMMEFAHKECNKGYALEKYSEIKNINLKDILSFGDTTNDNEMLEISTGVCLLNGSDDTKSFAKYITEKPVEDNGFTDFIDKYLLTK